MDDPCDDSYYSGLYDEISSLGANDDGMWSDSDGDGRADAEWDDMAYRYGRSHARCCDYDDGF